MTELRRLLESSDDELERALLGSALAERPVPSGLRDTALALGLTVSTANALAATLPQVSTLSAVLGAEATSAAAPMSVATTGVATTGVATTAVTTATVGAASLATLGKSLVVGAFVSFAALSGVDHTLGSSGSVPQPSAPATSSAVQPQSKPSAAFKIPSAVASSVHPIVGPSLPAAPPASAGSRSVVSRLTELPAAAGSAAPRGAAPASGSFEPVVVAAKPERVAESSAASLAAETRQLDRARAALAAGATEDAARLLDAYAAGRPSAVLSQEAALLRVRLLLARGQRAAAADLARRIIAQHPGSAHVDSLRQLVTQP